MTAHWLFRARFWFNNLHRGLLFGASGGLLSLGSPLGWLLLSGPESQDSDHFLLYLYLTAAPMLVFVIFGVYIGHLYNKIRKLADRDSLTGLLNQKSFYRIAEFMFAMAARRQEKIAVLMIDIDDFKKVNDFNNHLVGSYVLTEIAKIMRRSTRRSDILARFGGDEYIIFMNNASRQHTQSFAEKIREDIASSVFEWGRFQVNITVSIGLYIGLPDRERTLRDFVQAADASLYQAKAQGRNQVVLSECSV
ncbi:MAG: GGDEF domain-containing protein [Deltaproteobacteria bacterium]|nr:GGDEF domain-containing protein [Deltaproteobacteria bacterium]